MVIRYRALRLLTILLVLAAISGARMLAQAPAVSIDTLMAAPFPTDLVAAPTGGAIAWVSSASGVNNILIAEPSPGTGPLAGRSDHNDALIDQTFDLGPGETTQSGFQKQAGFQKTVQSNPGFSPRHPVMPVGQPVPPGWDCLHRCSGS